MGLDKSQLDPRRVRWLFISIVLLEVLINFDSGAVPVRARSCTLHAAAAAPRPAAN